MRLTKLFFILPCLMFSAALLAGCGQTSQENTVIEAPLQTEEELAEYEEQSYGDVDDEAQN